MCTLGSAPSHEPLSLGYKPESCSITLGAEPRLMWTQLRVLKYVEPAVPSTAAAGLVEARGRPRGFRGGAVHVDIVHVDIGLTPVLKALACFNSLTKSTSLSSHWFQISTCTPTSRRAWRRSRRRNAERPTPNTGRGRKQNQNKNKTKRKNTTQSLSRRMPRFEIIPPPSAAEHPFIRALLVTTS